MANQKDKETRKQIDIEKEKLRILYKVTKKLYKEFHTILNNIKKHEKSLSKNKKSK